MLVLGVLEPAFPGKALGDNGAEPVGPAQGVALVLLTLGLRLGQRLPCGINPGAKLVDLGLTGLRIGAVVEGCLRLFHRRRCVGQIGVEGRQGSAQRAALGLEPGDFRFGAGQFRLRAGQGAVSQLQALPGLRLGTFGLGQPVLLGLCSGLRGVVAGACGTDQAGQLLGPPLLFQQSRGSRCFAGQHPVAVPAPESALAGRQPLSGL